MKYGLISNLWLSFGPTCSTTPPSSLSPSLPSPHSFPCTLHHMTSLATLSLALSCISACISPYLPPILSSPLSSPTPSLPAISLPSPSHISPIPSSSPPSKSLCSCHTIHLQHFSPSLLSSPFALSATTKTSSSHLHTNFLPSLPKSSSYLPSLPKQKRPCNVPSPSSSTSHDTTQSSNISHRKNLSHHLSPKLLLSLS
jgi:hypothetical protein